MGRAVEPVICLFDQTHGILDKCGNTPPTEGFFDTRGSDSVMAYQPRLSMTSYRPISGVLAINMVKKVKQIR